jgi:hypothetical protein
MEVLNLPLNKRKRGHEMRIHNVYIGHGRVVKPGQMGGLSHGPHQERTIDVCVEAATQEEAIAVAHAAFREKWGNEPPTGLTSITSR